MISELLKPQVIASNTLNPKLLALGKRGYQFQQQVLRIPDRYGFFSPSPPRLQVYQAFLFTALYVMVICTSLMAVPTLFLASSLPVRDERERIQIWQPAALMVAIVVGAIAFIWTGACLHRNRAPDYVWKDWKNRADWTLTISSAVGVWETFWNLGFVTSKIHRILIVE